MKPFIINPEVNKIINSPEPLSNFLKVYINVSDEGYFIDEFINVGSSNKLYRIILFQKSVFWAEDDKIYRFSFDEVEIILREPSFFVSFVKGKLFISFMGYRNGDTFKRNFYIGRITREPGNLLDIDVQATNDFAFFFRNLIDFLRRGSRSFSINEIQTYSISNSILYPKYYSSYTSQERLILTQTRLFIINDKSIELEKKQVVNIDSSKQGELIILKITTSDGIKLFFSSHHKGTPDNSRTELLLQYINKWMRL